MPESLYEAGESAKAVVAGGPVPRAIGSRRARPALKMPDYAGKPLRGYDW
jgi:hypothetical protein